MGTLEELTKRLIADLPDWPEGRLPSVRMLASRYGCGARSIQSGMERLKALGLVESRPRSGLWRAGEVPERTEPAERATAQDMGDRLVRELREGRWTWEVPLPSLKELALLWNCHPQTAAKALAIASGAGLLERNGRRLFPMRPRLRRKVQAPHILCVGAVASDGHFWMDSDRESDFWRELGAQAAMAGVTLVRMPWTGGRIVPGSGAIGVVASTWHQHDPMAVCRELSRLRIPVCLWVEEHILEAPSLDSRIRFHDLGYSSSVGTAMGRHLLEQGHGHIAFLSPWQGSQWSRNRLQGLREAAKDRVGARVDAFCLDGESEWDHLIPARTDPTLVKHFPEAALARILGGSTQRVRDFVTAELGWNRVRQDMVPLMERALASGATAWVAANDICALYALRWLRERGVAVPDTISVAGFDDFVEALRADLTSYRFSSAGMARAMIHQILAPSRSHATLTRHEGMVVARATTAAPRR
ncbi:MAG: hypothetical protein RL318_848 [Fibrobacterota bacterium]|jgi:DNA-binding transcriptional regulator YhcF (GntR family)